MSGKNSNGQLRYFTVGISATRVEQGKTWVSHLKPLHCDSNHSPSTCPNAQGWDENTSRYRDTEGDHCQAGFYNHGNDDRASDWPNTLEGTWIDNTQP
jgi:hypothetical protein